MKPSEVAPFQEKLIAAQKLLLGENIQEEFGNVSESARSSADPMDAASMYEFADVLGMQSESATKALELIEAALGRIDEGTYGECVECEKNIPKTRLEALPFTPYCIACQRRIETGTDRVREQVRETLEEDDD